MEEQKDLPANDASKNEEMLKRMEEQTNRLQEATRKLNEARTLAEMERAEKALGGNSEGGMPKKEETPKEYKDRIMRGEL